MSTMETSSPSLDAGRPETSGDGQEALIQADLLPVTSEAARKAFRRLSGAVVMCRAVAEVLQYLGTCNGLQDLNEPDTVQSKRLWTLILCARNLLIVALADDALQQWPGMEHQTGQRKKELWRVYDLFSTAAAAIQGVDDADDAVGALGFAVPVLEDTIEWMDEVYVTGIESAVERAQWEPGSFH